VCFAESHGDRRVRRELLKDLDKQSLDEGGINRNFSHIDTDHLVTLTHHQNDAFKSGVLFGGLLQPLEGLSARIQLPTRAGD